MRKKDGMNLELEAALRSVQPQAARLDPTAAAFTAGQRTARRQLRLWQGVSAVFFLVAASSWVFPVFHGAQPGSGPVAMIFPAQPRGRQTSSEPLSQLTLARLQEAFEKKGIAGLPETSIPPLRPVRVDGL